MCHIRPKQGFSACPFQALMLAVPLASVCFFPLTEVGDWSRESSTRTHLRLLRTTVRRDQILASRRPLCFYVFLCILIFVVSELDANKRKKEIWENYRELRVIASRAHAPADG